MHLRIHGLAAIAALTCLIAPSRSDARDIDVPTLTGPVVDLADEIPKDREKTIDAKIREWRRTTGHQMGVLTVPDMQGVDIKEYAHQVGMAWRLGRPGADDSVILIHAVKERKVRIEVAIGLQPILTDGITSPMIQEITGSFKRGDFPGGLATGVDMIMTEASITPEQRQIDQERIRRVEAQRSADAKDAMLNVIGIMLLVCAAAVAGWGVWRLSTRKERAAAKLAQIQAQKLRAEERARQAEIDRQERIAAEEERQREIEAETQRRRQMLEAMTPAQRDAFLTEEREEAERIRLKAEADEAARRARAEEKERLRRIQQDEDDRERRREEAAAAAAAAAAPPASTWQPSSYQSESSPPPPPAPEPWTGGGGGGYTGGGSDGSY